MKGKGEEIRKKNGQPPFYFVTKPLDIGRSIIFMIKS